MMSANLEPSCRLVASIKELPENGIFVNIKAEFDSKNVTGRELIELSRLTTALAIGLKIVGTPAHAKEAETLMQSACDLTERAKAKGC